jgi:hypothetical protein
MSETFELKAWYNINIENALRRDVGASGAVRAQEACPVSDTDSTIPQKTCTKCGQTFPATTEYFYKQKSGKYGLQARCRPCTILVCRKWCNDHREQKREIDKKWYRENIEFARGQRTAWRKKHNERHKSMIRRWFHSHPEQSRIHTHKRRARVRSLPNALTPQQWQHAINHFNGCCAVCGRQANDLFATHSLSMDHWIPISNVDCPGTVAWNIVPLCHGQDGCNNSKNDRPAMVWLIEKFGKRKASEVMRRILEYLESVKQ